MKHSSFLIGLLSIFLIGSCQSRNNTALEKQKLDTSYKFLTLVENGEFENAKVMIAGKDPYPRGTMYDIRKISEFIKKYGKPGIESAVVKKDKTFGMDQVTVSYDFASLMIAKDNLKLAKIEFVFLQQKYGDSIVHIQTISRFSR